MGLRAKRTAEAATKGEASPYTEFGRALLASVACPDDGSWHSLAHTGPNNPGMCLRLPAFLSMMLCARGLPVTLSHLTSLRSRETVVSLEELPH